MTRCPTWAGADMVAGMDTVAGAATPARSGSPVLSVQSLDVTDDTGRNPYWRDTSRTSMRINQAPQESFTNVTVLDVNTSVRGPEIFVVIFSHVTSTKLRILEWFRF